MRILLDTHAFLWWITNDPQLSEHAREIMGNGDDELVFSAASAWEISIKAELGRLILPDVSARFVPEQLALNGIGNLPILLSHALHAGSLPGHHRDPFDRMLVAQSQIEHLPILTADAEIRRYDVETLW